MPFDGRRAQKKLTLHLNHHQGEDRKKLERPIMRKKRRLRTGVFKLTEKITNKFCDLVAEGVPAGTACAFLGISNTAFHAWIRKGEDFIDSGGEPREHRMYGVFVRAYKRAAASYLIKRHRILHTTDDKNWYREVVILERRDKKNWSKEAPQGGNEEAFQSDEKFV